MPDHDEAYKNHPVEGKLIKDLDEQRQQEFIEEAVRVIAERIERLDNDDARKDVLN